MKNSDRDKPGKSGVLSGYFFWGREKRETERKDRKGLENYFIKLTVLKI